jgi:hypothetical protein
MSLKALHVLFITASTLLALGVAVWAFRTWSAGAGAGYLGLAGGSALFAVALVVYGAWFLKKMKGVSYL